MEEAAGRAVRGDEVAGEEVAGDDDREDEAEPPDPADTWPKAADTAAAFTYTALGEPVEPAPVLLLRSLTGWLSEGDLIICPDLPPPPLPPLLEPLLPRIPPRPDGVRTSDPTPLPGIARRSQGLQYLQTSYFYTKGLRGGTAGVAVRECPVSRVDRVHSYTALLSDRCLLQLSRTANINPNPLEWNSVSAT